MNLGNIVERERTVFVDGSALQPINTRLCTNIFPVQRAAQLRFLPLREYAAELLETTLELASPNVATTWEVAAEVKKLSSILNDKFHYLKTKPAINRDKKHRENEAEGIECFEIAVAAAYDLYQRVRACTRRFDDPRYLFLKSLVQDIMARHLICNNIKGKRPDCDRGLRNIEKRSYDGDSSLVAAALYVASLEKDRCAIVTSDQDILFLVKHALDELKLWLGNAHVSVYLSRKKYVKEWIDGEAPSLTKNAAVYIR